MLKLRRAKLGLDNQLTLQTEARLASLLENLGREDGKGALETVLERQRQVLGSSHTDTLATLHAILHVYERKEAYSEALFICDELIGAYKKISVVRLYYTGPI